MDFKPLHHYMDQMIDISTKSIYLTLYWCEQNCEFCNTNVKLFIHKLRSILDGIGDQPDIDMVKIMITFEEWNILARSNTSWKLDEHIDSNCIISSTKIDMYENFGILFGIDTNLTI